MSRNPLREYGFSALLIFSILAGALTGYFLKEKSIVLKPLGDLFLNLLFTAAIPLIFFSIASAVAGMRELRELGKIFFWMMTIFTVTGIIASVTMLAVVSVFPPDIQVTMNVTGQSIMPERGQLLDTLVSAFTVSDFSDLFSKKNVLALIVFALFVGTATSALGQKAKAFEQFLLAGNEVMLKVIGYIMTYAPIGLACYFAYLVGTLGPQLMGAYAQVLILYYPTAFLYFFIAFSFYLGLAGGFKLIIDFWKNILLPSLTALGTGSSVATIPSNLQAADRMGVPRKISELVIPVGATIHMEGSCLSAILKIALLFHLFNMPFTGWETYGVAVGIALLSGTVMAGIPGGGFLGEILIVTLYGFPPEALPVISMVGTLVDPPATMINAIGDNVSSLLIARILR